MTTFNRITTKYMLYIFPFLQLLRKLRTKINAPTDSKYSQKKILYLKVGVGLLIESVGVDSQKEKKKKEKNTSNQYIFCYAQNLKIKTGMIVKQSEKK